MTTRHDMLRLRRRELAGIVVAAMLLPAAGCGMEDFQRDLLAAGLVAAVLQESASDRVEDSSGQSLTERGIDCWDVNRNGVSEAAEDTNGDGRFDASDCQGTALLDDVDATEAIDCWDVNENGHEDLAEDINGDGQHDGADCQGMPGPPGPQGARGRPGSGGHSMFHVYIDDFFVSAERTIDATAAGVGALGQPAVDVTATLIDNRAVAFRTVIPTQYESGNDVSLRLHLRSISNGDDACFIVTLSARRVRPGGRLAPWDRTSAMTTDVCDAQPSTAGCGRRWIRVVTDSLDRDDVVDGGSGKYVTVDLPVNTAVGLDFPDDLAVADVVAFELGVFVSDETGYELLSAELYESRANTAALSGASVLSTPPSVPDQASACDAFRLR